MEFQEARHNKYQLLDMILSLMGFSTHLLQIPLRRLLRQQTFNLTLVDLSIEYDLEVVRQNAGRCGLVIL